MADDIIDGLQVWRDSEKRVSVYTVLIKWNKDGLTDLMPRWHMGAYNDHAAHLCWLMGREEIYAVLPMSEREHEICAALCGPHGYAIYKAMRAKHGT